MLSTEAKPSAASSGTTTRGLRRRHPMQSGTGRLRTNGAVDANSQDRAATEPRAIPAGGASRIRVRRGSNDDTPEPTAAYGGNRASRRARRALDAAAHSEGDPDDQLQLTLDLTEPEPRGYEATAKPPRPRIDTTRWLWWAMGMGSVTCPILLGFQLVFTDPTHGLNVLAVVVTMSFGALFATWTFEYWLRRGTAAPARNLPIWTLTRHAVLASVGVAAMAVSALNRTASFGLLILLIFTLIVADIVLRRLRIR